MATFISLDVLNLMSTVLEVLPKYLSYMCMALLLARCRNCYLLKAISIVNLYTKEQNDFHPIMNDGGKYINIFKLPHIVKPSLCNLKEAYDDKCRAKALASAIARVSSSLSMASPLPLVASIISELNLKVTFRHDAFGMFIITNE